MKVLIFTLGTRGDVQPYIALGRALIAAGHDVVLSTGEGFDDFIEDHGIRPSSVPVDVRALLETPEIQAAMHSISGRIKAWRMMRGQHVRQSNAMLEITRAEKPDLIVGHPKSFCAREIARALGIVFVPTMLQPIFPATAEFPHFIFTSENRGPAFNCLTHRAVGALCTWGWRKTLGRWPRDTLGLTTPVEGDPFAGYHPEGFSVPRLHGYSRHVLPTPGDWGPEEKITGYWFMDQAASFDPPANLLTFLETGSPPVYVGFGSMPSEDAVRQTGIVAEALRLAGKRGILATGWGGLDEKSGGRTIHMLDAAPHDWLFPRCSAVVHHGGAGTTHEGLRWGRPTIVCPHFVDQPFWGRRIAAIGAGPLPIHQKRLSSGALAAALLQAHEPAIVRKADELGGLVRAEEGIAEAVALLEAIPLPGNSNRN